ncbi:MAG: hypothetical protein LBQ49_02975 [Rickettsiales bacterium]|jgi:hypothetical protein|nr:hypothetical protein [Rickettsiales bacterium]
MNRKHYKTLMRLDGARVRDLNFASAVDYIGAVVGPVFKTIGKVAGMTVVSGGLAVSPLGLTGCPQEPKNNGGGKTDPKKCECSNGSDHWEGEECCKNNDGNKTDDCTCNSIAKASGEHVAGTERYEGDDGGCYVKFNGQSVKRPGDNCKVHICPKPAEHYLTCADYGCEVGGHQQTPRGYITERNGSGVATGKQIQIYQKLTDDAAAAITAAGINYEWDNYVDDAGYAKMEGRLQEIWIIQTATDQTNYYDYEVVGKNKVILKIQHSLDEWYYANVFFDFAVNVLPGLNLTQVKRSAQGKVQLASVGASGQHLKQAVNPKKLRVRERRAVREYVAMLGIQNGIRQNVVQVQNGRMI